MQAVLVALNARYSHTNLAVRYLSRLDSRIRVAECSINDNPWSILDKVLCGGETLVLFSAYIWNIQLVLEIAEMTAKARPGVHIGLGGPEAGYNASALLAVHPFITYILQGEGEVYFSQFLDAAARGGGYPAGVSWRGADGVHLSPDMPTVLDLSALPFPYSEDEPLEHRIPYYETSRGCPYACGFCLSSAVPGVRYLPAERVKRELLWFVRRGVPLVKLVDRTFNSDDARAVELVEFLKAHAGGTCFHFEIRAETVSDALLDSLCNAPPGLFQLEIGVQSTHPDTLHAIGRRADFASLSRVVRRLREGDNIPLHLDLIAGLPHEDTAAFRTSFNDVYALRPHMLQLGFLKRLHGARLRFEGQSFCSFPPYEVVASDAMSACDLLWLKEVEQAVDRYYNSGVFTHTLDYLVRTRYPGDPFALYDALAGWCRERTAGDIGRREAYRLLLEWLRAAGGDNRAEELLRFDYFLHHRDTPAFFYWHDCKQEAFAFLRDEQNVRAHLPVLAGRKPADVYKRVRAQRFAFDVRSGEGGPVTLMLEEESGRLFPI